MNRQTTLLASLGVVLILVAFFFLAYQPKSNELAEVQEEIDGAVAQQATLEARVAELEAVRAQAPEIEATLAKAESIIPQDAALPSALRQLQLAADDSGVTLRSVAPGRPAAVAGDVPDLATITVAVTLEGSYFQVVDFLRRVEDPAIVPRGIVWGSTILSPSDYPTLSVVLTGEMFALLPAPVVVEPETPAPTEAETTEESAA